MKSKAEWLYFFINIVTLIIGMFLCTLTVVDINQYRISDSHINPFLFIILLIGILSMIYSVFNLIIFFNEGTSFRDDIINIMVKK